MKIQILQRLDEIIELEPHLIDDVEVLDLMEQYADGPRGLRTLIERYGHSNVPIIARTVSYLLAKASRMPTQETLDAAFLMIRNLRCGGDDETLENCLTAFVNLISSPSSKKTFSQPYPVLYTFLMQCLNGFVTVQHGALQVISLLHFEELFFDVFTQSQIDVICTRLKQLSTRHEELLDLELENLSLLLTPVKISNPVDSPPPFECPFFEFTEAINKGTAAGELFQSPGVLLRTEEQTVIYEVKSSTSRDEPARTLMTQRWTEGLDPIPAAREKNTRIRTKSYELML